MARGILHLITSNDSVGKEKCLINDIYSMEHFCSSTLIPPIRYVSNK